jgi:hypothetical protein
MEIGRSMFRAHSAGLKIHQNSVFWVGATPWLGRSFRPKPGLYLGDCGLPLMIAFPTFREECP